MFCKPNKLGTIILKQKQNTWHHHIKTKTKYFSDMENLYHRQRVKWVTFNVGDTPVMIRYKFETSNQSTLVRFTVNLFDLANLLVVLGEPNLAQIELELEMQVNDGDTSTILPLPIPQNILLATPSQLIQAELESNTIW